MSWKILKISFNSFQRILQHSKFHDHIRYMSESMYKINIDDKNEGKEHKSNKFSCRSFNCGQLRGHNIGETVTLCGWVEFQRMKKFILLRDGYGQTQLLLDKNNLSIHKALDGLTLESVIQVKGSVQRRPENMVNNKQVTGEIEVVVDEIVVLNRATDTLPFNIRNFQKANEALRMQYRYLDLRFAEMQANLRMRSNVTMKMREYLVNKLNFVDVETPTLFKATPGGAQEFIVPTKFPGQFYSLTQSPQQFKQMLMAGGIDRYFQIARCYRDETSRPDRQPEFTQLDLEMSFTTREHIMSLIEELIHHSLPEVFDRPPPHFQRMKYSDAFEMYGTDQPDVRYDYKIIDCSEFLENDGNLFCVCFEGFKFNNEIKKKIELISKYYPKAKLLAVQTDDKRNVMALQALIGSNSIDKLLEYMDSSRKVTLFAAVGERKQVLSLLGKIRTETAFYWQQNGNSTIIKNGLHFLWITDFPLFEKNEHDTLSSVHHPFTAPHPEDLHLLTQNPLQVRSLAYDLVLNGNEIGGGSIRIHQRSLQERILKILNIPKSSLEHMLQMLESGCPPHGGIALGLDRFIANLVGAKSIRDVIAFPKSFDGKDPLSGAPSQISEEIKNTYHIQSVYNK